MSSMLEGNHEKTERDHVDGDVCYLNDPSRSS